MQSLVPTLYVANTNPLPVACQAAIDLLDGAQCQYELKRVPIFHEMAIVHGLPSLTVSWGNFEGLSGIKIFIENATYLHWLPVRPIAPAG